jgi:DNA-directed RNA polymerase subunit K/omega
MQVFTPNELAKHASNKYLSVLVAAQYARAMNELPRLGGTGREKKLTTRALEELAGGNISFRIVPRRRPE